MFKIEGTFLANHCYCQINIDGLKFHSIQLSKNSFILSDSTLGNDKRTDAQAVAYFDCQSALV